MKQMSTTDNRIFRYMQMKIEDKVAYSVQWLKNTGLSHSEFSHYRGCVVGVEPMGQATLVEVKWDHGEISKVLEDNLALIALNTKFSQC